MNNSNLLLLDWKVHNCSINCLLIGNEHGYLKSSQVPLTFSKADNITCQVDNFIEYYTLLLTKDSGKYVNPRSLTIPILTQAFPCPNICGVEEGQKKRSTGLCSSTISLKYSSSAAGFKGGYI